MTQPGRSVRALGYALAMAPAWALFFLMIFVPTAYKPVKLALVVLVSSIALLTLARARELSLHPGVLAWSGLFVVAGTAFVLLGLVREAPGALRMAPLYVVWPIAYSLFVAAAASRKVLRALDTVLVAASFAVPLQAAIYVLVEAGLLPSYLLIPLDVEPNIGFYAGFVQIHLTTLASLLFLVPYLMAAVTVYPAGRSRAMRQLLWLALLLGVAVVVLSLRRGIILAVLLAPLVIGVLVAFQPGAAGRESRRRLTRLTISLAALLVCVGAYAHLVYEWSPDNMASVFQAGFDFESRTEVGATARAVQFSDLMHAWASDPIFGAGAGAYVPTIVREPDMPWAYELSYVSLLFQTGMVGFGLYALGGLWIFGTSIRMIRSGHPLGIQLLPVLAGTACFLVANASNPYLAKFDYLWVLFLPVAFINLWLLEGRPATRSEAVVPRPGRPRPAVARV